MTSDDPPFAELKRDLLDQRALIANCLAAIEQAEQALAKLHARNGGIEPAGRLTRVSGRIWISPSRCALLASSAWIPAAPNGWASSVAFQALVFQTLIDHYSVADQPGRDCGFLREGIMKKLQHELDEVDPARRTALLFGLFGASALALGNGRCAVAQAAQGEVREIATGVTLQTVGEVESSFPEFAKIRLDEVTWQPGARSGPSTMEHPMICEMSQGALDETKDGRPITRKTGDLWTCAIGEVDVDVNNGSDPATMRIFRLLKA
jgi:hypothetical protein